MLTERLDEEAKHTAAAGAGPLTSPARQLTQPGPGGAGALPNLGQEQERAAALPLLLKRKSLDQECPVPPPTLTSQQGGDVRGRKGPRC